MIGGLGSLWGALVASLLIGWTQTFAVSYNISMADVLTAVGFTEPVDLSDHPLADLWSLTLPQIGPILPYLLMVLVLAIWPQGLFGKRET